MTERTTLYLHARHAVGEVSPRIFGGFLEHMGRAVYGGLYDPESRHADADGTRGDVLEALRELRMTVMRYPGGNFVSGYHWRDGVGPRDRRPTVRELAWQSIEPNRFGTDEFIRLCRKLDWQPMLAVNLGTGTPEEARDWVEYCNSPVGTRNADLRAANGSAEPHAVPLWCLGNEMDGFWQLGHVPAKQYALRARQAAQLMKACDRSIETVACGTSHPEMPSFLKWDRAVLQRLGELADYISLHRYVGNYDDDSREYLALSKSIDRQIESVDACARYVQQRLKLLRRAYLSFDEWNVWYRTFDLAKLDGQGKFAPPLIEERYNLEDALVVGQFLMSFIRHADSVKIANFSQVVNVIAPLLTLGDELLKQSIYYAFRMFSSRRGGVSLRCPVDGPSYASERHGEVPCLDCAAVLDGTKLHVFAVNRHLDGPLELAVDFAGADIAQVADAEILCADLKAENSFESPDEVRPETFDGWSVSGPTGNAAAMLPAHSLVATSFELAG
ncbi:MAG: alpha-N-arabinofuranosidase [Proteobacteria bacterium]|nr:alpha-N-arabinofuranosidase [Pseudomonadota bacterium]